MLLSSFLIDNIIISVVSVSLSKIELTVLNMEADSVKACLCLKLHWSIFFILTMDQMSICTTEDVTRSGELRENSPLSLRSLFWFYGPQALLSPTLFPAVANISFHCKAEKPIVHYLLSTKQQTDLVTSWWRRWLRLRIFPQPLPTSSPASLGLKIHTSGFECSIY